MAIRPAVLVTVLCLALPIAAQAGADPQQGACTPDAARLCGSDVSSVARTAACLVAHRAQLSATCRNVFVSAEPTAYTPPPEEPRPAHAPVARRSARAPLARQHAARADLAQPYRQRHRAHLARRAIPYHIPRFDQAQAEAEVHTQYRYRTPYLPYWVFP